MVHCRDHAAHSTHIYCPFLYWTVLKKTFSDIEVYTHLSLTPPQATSFLQTLAPISWLRKYKRGINFTAECPISYILLKKKKKKKAFLAARPIISHKDFVFAKSRRATAIARHYIHQQSWPDAFGHAALPQIFISLHQYLHQVPLDIDMVVHNQDLAGFFTSIPATRIIATLTTLIDTYFANNPHSNSESYVSIDLQQTDSQRGKHRKPSKQPYQLRMGDIIPLAKLSLEASIFSQMGQRFQQVRGSAIGNQISPIRTQMAPVITTTTTSHFFHLPVCGQPPHPHPPVRPISPSSRTIPETVILYQDPVVLEDEPDSTFLGCVINPQTHTFATNSGQHTHAFT